MAPALLVLLWACGGGDAAPADAGAAPAGVPAADSVSLAGVRRLVEVVGAERLFERVAEPNPYLTDFFGIQPLQAVSPERILADLVPQYGEVLSRAPDALILELTDGPRVAFRFGTDLVVNGNPVVTEFARVEIRDSAGYPREPAAFRAVLEEAGLADTYLVPNPYFAAEQAVLARMRDTVAIEPVPVSPDTTGFVLSAHAAILVGETHGGTEAYERARAILESPAVDWIAIEMLGEDLQPALDRYLETADEAVRSAARAELLAFYAANWNTRGHEITATPAENPYFRLIETARALGKPVFALDTETRFILFRFGEFPLGATVRDLVWSSNVPRTGRGVIYGGSAHFRPVRRPNMLTFLHERDPDIMLFRSGAGD